MKTIYSAENKLSYVLDFLKEQTDKDIKLYQPSKNRYDKMLMQSKEIMQLLCKLLQQDELDDDETKEFENSSYLEGDKKVINDVISDMQDMVSKLQSFNSSSSPAVSNMKEEEKSESFNSDERHNILISYSNAVNNVIRNSKNLYETECAHIIQDWMSVRFDKKICPTFKYNICNLPKWIGDIVYTYGSFVTSEFTDEFVREFYSWIDVIKGGKNTYPLPYIVNQVVRDNSNNHVSLAGPVLWDMMIDDGLAILKDNELHLPNNPVYEKCNEVLEEFGDNGELDTYTYYKFDESILVRSKLVREVDHE